MSKWAKAKLGDYIQEYSERNKDNAEFPVYSVTNSNGFCTEYFSKEVASKDKTTYKIVKKGYFAYNPSRINVGSVDWLREKETVIVSPLYNVFSVTNGLYQQYLYYYLKSNVGLYYIKELATGSVRDNLKFSILKDFYIPLPPVEVQKQISNALDKATYLINLCNTILEKLDLIVKARFVEMFGDPVSNPKKWNTKTFLDIGKCKNGMNFHYNDNGVDIHCLGVGDFKDLSIITDTSILPKISLNEIPTDDYLLQNDDIVFVRSNGNKTLVGRSLAIYPDDIPTTFSGFCIRFRKEDDSVIIPYLLRVLKAESIRKKMSGRGANIQNLNQQILSSLEIPIPPIDLQTKFSTFVEQTDKLKLTVKKVREKAETLKKALMQNYFG